MKQKGECFNTVDGRCCCNYYNSSMKRKGECFNTVNGNHCCFITFVLPLLRSGTCNVWASSSLCSSSVSYSAAHTASSRYCCNKEDNKKVATNDNSVSIPQAVVAITLSSSFYRLFVQVLEMCGPHRRFAPLLPRTLLSIP